MNCVMCDGTTTATTRPKAVERDGRIAVIRDVPVEVCDSCGEICLDATVAKQLDVLFRQMLAGPVDEAVGHYIEAALPTHISTPLTTWSGSRASSR